MNIKLDDNDVVRLERIILKEENAQLRFSLAQHECLEERSELFRLIAAKYSIDVTKHQMSVNLSERTITLMPREMPPAPLCPGNPQPA
jgi:hypothetical protein